MERVQGFIVVLGSLNTRSGDLHLIGKERCDAAFNEYKRLTGWKVLLTGGYGSHFNTSDKPHAAYLKEYLIKRGLQEQDFVEFAESANTLEDASRSKPIALRYRISEMLVVTSDFHVERARYIFEKEFSGTRIDIKFLVLQTDDAKAGFDLERQVKHERAALASLKRTHGQTNGPSNFDSNSLSTALCPQE